MLAILTIGTEYLSRKIEFLTIVSILAIFYIIFRNDIRKKEISIFIGYLIMNLGVILSKLLFTPEISIAVNMGFIVKTLLFGFFLIYYLNRYYNSHVVLVVISFFSLPHFIGYILGVLPPIEYSTYIGQFGGFHGDPNYLSPDLLAALTAQLFISRMEDKRLLKVINYLNLFITLLLIYYTQSRSAIMASTIIFILFLSLIYKTEKKGKFFLTISGICIVIFLGITFFFEDAKIAQLIYQDFTRTEGGGSLLENERFIVWGLAFDTINNSGLFSGIGTSAFTQKIYRFYTHNVFLNAGIVYGKYTFYAHLTAVIFGLYNFIYKFFKKVYRVGFNDESFIFVLTFSQIFMLSSISVSQKYVYWFVLSLIIIYGVFTPEKFKRH